MPLFFELSPEALLSKARLAFISNEAETSEKPEYEELKTRRYALSVKEVYEIALGFASRWVNWRVVNRGKNFGGMAQLKCDVYSVLLGGNKLELSLIFSEERTTFGGICTVVNAKSVSTAPTKGDLGENRRWIALMLYSLDTAVAERLEELNAQGIEPGVLQSTSNSTPESNDAPIKQSENTVTPSPDHSAKDSTPKEAPQRKRLTIKQL
ncbi:MAG: hypothetical protein SFU91_12100 [Chloroherpetonaceae bacterium]|nr:hypothetical protein [Chloroherpetonaceae bacterium]